MPRGVTAACTPHLQSLFFCVARTAVYSLKSSVVHAQLLCMVAERCSPLPPPWELNSKCRRQVRQLEVQCQQPPNNIGGPRVQYKYSTLGAVCVLELERAW